MKRRTFMVAAAGLPAMSCCSAVCASRGVDGVVVDSGLVEAAGLMRHAAGCCLPVFDVSRDGGGDVAVLWYRMLSHRFGRGAAQGALIGVTRPSDFFVLQRLVRRAGVVDALASDFAGSAAVGFVLGL
jgi:hypothetical protein